MKKIGFIGVILFAFFSILPVRALEYDLNTLIPINTQATVHTERFDYIDFVFSSQLNEKGYATIHFSSIKNNMVTKNPITINILLFDQEKKNIGYLTYCSDKDFDSNYSGFKLNGNATTSFTISVLSKYYVEGKNSKDVSYIVVADENKYCEIGGYTKYSGQTLEQILEAEKAEAKDPVIDTTKFILDKAIHFYHSRYMKYTLIGLGALIVFIAFGHLLNALYQRMYTHKSSLVFLPIIDAFVTVKLVFGNIIMFVYIILCIGAGVLFYLGIKIGLFIVLGLWFLSILLVIIKLITKKYDLFYFEPSMDSSKYMKPVPSEKEIKDDVIPKKEESLLDDDALDLNQHNTPTEVADIDTILESLENPDGTDNKF